MSKILFSREEKKPEPIDANSDKVTKRYYK